MDKVVWSGQSGRHYEYDILPIGGEIPSLAGNYVFCKGWGGSWHPVYVGETSDLNTRISNHHQMPCIERNGATHVSYRLHSDGSASRRAEEQDIIEWYRPACNAGAEARPVWEAVGELRDAINELHPIPIRIRRAGDGSWYALWAHVDALADAVRAAAVYDRTRPVANWNEHSTELRALFGAFSTQTEAVEHIAKLVGMDWNPNRDLKKNEKIRNRLIHPQTGYVLYTHSVDKPKFQLIKYPITGSGEGVIDAGECQDLQSKGLQDKIASIIAYLWQEQQKWAKQEQAKGSLWEILKFLDYPIGNVGDRSRNWELGSYEEVASAFTRLRKRLMEMEYEDDFCHELDAAIAGLELWREDIAKSVRSESSASFLRGSLRYYLKRLRGFTAMLDAEIDDAANGRTSRKRESSRLIEFSPTNYEAAMRALDDMSEQERETLRDGVAKAEDARRREKDAEAYMTGSIY